MGAGLPQAGGVGLVKLRPRWEDLPAEVREHYRPARVHIVSVEPGEVVLRAETLWGDEETVLWRNWAGRWRAHVESVQRSTGGD
jgi:hypothetical protein